VPARSGTAPNERGEVKRLITVVVALVAVLGLTVAAAAAPRTGSDSKVGPRVDTSRALVQLKGDPVASSSKTRPAPGKKIDFGATHVKNYRAELSALRNEFKQWLRTNVPAARVTGEFDVALNAVSVDLNGASLDAIKAAPQVQSAEYEGLYYPLAHGHDPDLTLIDAFTAWGGEGGASIAGQGIKVAIIDSGIDASHPCFAGGADPTPNDPHTNAKVLNAAVYYMQNNRTRFTPADANGHGTHVAGTVACNFNTAATVSEVAIPYGVSGVAPAAKLGNFNVFPGDVGNARSEDIVNALEDALELGYDVANMSLGGGSRGFNDLLAMATDNADQAGMVVAVAAGNSGPGAFTIESPGKAARALTAGASTVPHFVGAQLKVGSATYGAAVGDFPTVKEDLSAQLGVVMGGPAIRDGLNEACAALSAGSLSNRIAVVSRGTCTFSEKIRNAQNAGAVATIVVNNVAGDPTAMGLGGIPNEPTIPAYMVAMQHRQALIAANNASATITKAMAYFLTENKDIRAGFSSEGPTDVDFRVKPDVMAPGVNVLSAQPASACPVAPCWAFFQGTSMATPHLAGSAAFIASKKPTWSAADIRSAIVNTADQNVITSHTNGTTTLTNVNIIGTGRENLNAALNAKVALDPVSVSFGSTPSGSGQSLTRTVSVNSLGGSATRVAVTDQTGNGVTFNATLSAGTITVTMATDRRVSAGHKQGILRVYNGNTEIAHAAIYALIK
jgi:minor extracellular serine protease Vpr